MVWAVEASPVLLVLLCSHAATTSNVRWNRDVSVTKYREDDTKRDDEKATRSWKRRRHRASLRHPSPILMMLMPMPVPLPATQMPCTIDHSLLLELGRRRQQRRRWKRRTTTKRTTTKRMRPSVHDRRKSHLASCCIHRREVCASPWPSTLVSWLRWSRRHATKTMRHCRQSQNRRGNEHHEWSEEDST